MLLNTSCNVTTMAPAILPFRPFPSLRTHPSLQSTKVLRHLRICKLLDDRGYQVAGQCIQVIQHAPDCKSSIGTECHVLYCIGDREDCLKQPFLDGCVTSHKELLNNVGGDWVLGQQMHSHLDKGVDDRNHA